MSDRTSPRTFGRALSLAALLATLASPACPAAAPAAPAASAASAASDLEWLRHQTVWIRVHRPDSENPLENGSGILLCEVAHRVYLLSANHVIFGATASGKLHGSLRGVSRIEVEFHDGIARTVVEEPQSETRSDVIQKTQIGNRDLLLLSFDVTEELAARAALGASSALTAEGGKERTVLAVGYHAVDGKAWDARSGRLTRQADGLLVHTAPIVGGFSGGPLFDSAGALVGMNVQMIGDAANSQGGYALPVEDIRDAIGKLVPAVCLKNEREEESRRRAAEDHYRTALREVSRHDWAAADRSLALALDNNPFEGGSVHLQGMRYAQYLPHFYRGLVHYHQSLERRRNPKAETESCGKALNELALSEVQGAIQSNPRRLRELRKIAAKCGRQGAVPPSSDPSFTDRIFPRSRG